MPNPSRCARKTTVGSRLPDTSTVIATVREVNTRQDDRRLIRIPQRRLFLLTLEKHRPPGHRKTSANSTIGQAQLLVHCATPGLIVVETLDRLADRHLAITANGIMDNLPGRPFFVWVANLRETPLHLPKHTAVGKISTDPLRIIQIPRRASHRQDPAVLLTKQTSASQSEDDTNLAAETAGTTESEDPPHWPIPETATPPWNKTPPPRKDDVSPGWHTQVSIRATQEAECSRVVDFLTPFADMWDGHLGNIKFLQHRIDLQPESIPVHQTPYRAGPHNRAQKKKKSTKCWKWES